MGIPHSSRGGSQQLRSQSPSTTRVCDCVASSGHKGRAANKRCTKSCFLTRRRTDKATANQARKRRACATNVSISC